MIDITVWADDPIDLSVNIIPQTSSSSPVECVSDSPEILTIEQKSGNMFHINCVDNGTLPKSCKMTFKCADIEKIFTVYCRPEK